MVNMKQMLWEAYGPHQGALPADGQVVVQGLQSRADLNEKCAKILRWDGLSGRFIVALADTDERIKVKSLNLRIKGCVGEVALAHSENQITVLPPHVTLSAAVFLRPRCVAHLSAGCRALRAALWLQADAEPLWEMLLVRRFGNFAVDVARSVRPSVAGPSLYRCARGLRHLFRESLEVVRGGVHEQATGFEVVACPVVQDLILGGFGAQIAVRRAGGQALEQAIAEVPTPVPEMSTTLVHGGNLAQKVALTVTQPPRDLWNSLSGTREEAVGSILGFLETIHSNLLRVVREAGHRSLAMPTLCTGGMGMPAHLVAISAVKAIHKDYCDHAADPIRVRVACFEVDHIPAFNSIKDAIYEQFYMPSEIHSNLRSSLFDTENHQEAHNPDW
mmetsp:Transcript_30180/g.54866  ORF Transcript_30180/g.54866 Transcript_30180/m.54866 type:complete len:389 (+) Transcript_30180:65-1231(+)